MRLHYPPNYVLDEMQWYEIAAALKYQYYAIKDNWEQARLIAYIIAQSNSTKRITQEDVVKFYWDDEKDDHDDEDTKPITKADIERLSQKAQQLIDKNII